MPNLKSLIGYAGICLLGCTLALFVHTKATQDNEAALARYRTVSESVASSVASKMEMNFRQIYLGLRTLATIPSIRSLDRHGKNLSLDGYNAANEIYKNLAANFFISELYVVPVTLNPDAIDPQTQAAEMASLKFDGSQTPPNANATSGQKDGAADKPEEVATFLYRQLAEQMNFLKANFGTADKIARDNPPMLSGEEIITNDNTDFNKTKADKDRKGLVFSVPYYSETGELKGTITAVIRSNMLQGLLHEANYALVNPDYHYVLFPLQIGQESRSPQVSTAQTDPDLYFSDVFPLNLNDPRSHWSLWAGFPNSQFNESPEVQSIKSFSLTGYCASALLTLLGCLLYYRDQTRRLRIETTNAELEEQLAARIIEIHQSAREQMKLKEELKARREEISQSAQEQQKINEEAKLEKVRSLQELAKGFEERVLGSVTELGGSANLVSGTLADLTETASKASEQFVQAQAIAYQASNNIQVIACATEELTASMSRITSEATQASEIAKVAAVEVAHTNNRVQNLSDAAVKIGSVATLVKDIADKTNMVALNASIEAARAGEAGMGIATIAQDVKQLAQQAARATVEITAQINSIQTTTDEAVLAIAQITSTIGAINQIQAAISQGMREQDSFTQEISRTAQETAQGAVEVTRNISSVAETTNIAGTNTQALLNATNSLAAIADSLRGDVMQLLLDVKAG